MARKRTVRFVTELIIASSGTIAAGACEAAEVASRYVRQVAGSDTAIVFVHGVLGDGQTTWSNGTAYWPTMLAADHAFDGADIFVYAYPTSMWATLSPDELAENLRLQLNAHGVSNHQRLVFLTHSLGGLVTRAYLLKNRAVADRTTFAYFYSTPTEGSQVASLATLLSRNPQFGNMKPIDADNYLGNLLRQWLSAQYKIASYCAYEKRSTYGLPIVTFQSASALCNKPLDPIDLDHINIVKPSNIDAYSYLAFKAAYQIEMHAASPNQSLLTQYERVLNKLNSIKMTQEELLFPQLSTYLDNPSEARWRDVKATAATLIGETKDLIESSRSFDSQFYDQGGAILALSDGAMQVVSRSYYQPFKEVRQVRGSKLAIYDEISNEDRPTREQALAWASELKGRYDRMKVELVRLIEIVRLKT
jgi:pimeloyl-ACP methyl ester carboxylesterase